jgi:hypothetical protein
VPGNKVDEVPECRHLVRQVFGMTLLAELSGSFSSFALGATAPEAPLGFRESGRRLDHHIPSHQHLRYCPRIYPAVLRPYCEASAHQQ